jgi:hypothetical protein
MGSAPLPIRTGDVDGPELMLRISEQITKQSDVGKILFDSRIPNALKHRE